jgi:hypothetical protein
MNMVRGVPRVALFKSQMASRGRRWQVPFQESCCYRLLAVEVRVDELRRL